MSESALDRATAESLLALTRRMSAAAGEADWDGVAADDARRRTLLAGGAGTTDGERARAPSPSLVEALREADRELLERTREARSALGERTRRTRTERDVCRTYADVMRGVGSAGTGG